MSFVVCPFLLLMYGSLLHVNPLLRPYTEPRRPADRSIAYCNYTKMKNSQEAAHTIIGGDVVTWGDGVGALALTKFFAVPQKMRNPWRDDGGLTVSWN